MSNMGQFKAPPPQALMDLGQLLREQHPQDPLDIFRSIARTHVHQVKAAILPRFRIYDFGRSLGLDEDVIKREVYAAEHDVSRAYRAVNAGSRRHLRGLRMKPERYVTKDWRIVVF